LSGLKAAMPLAARIPIAIVVTMLSPATTMSVAIAQGAAIAVMPGGGDRIDQPGIWRFSHSPTRPAAQSRRQQSWHIR
jgi:hypothetical protein